MADEYQNTKDIPELTRLLVEGWGRGGPAEERLMELLHPRLLKRARPLVARNPRLGVTAEELVSIVYVRLRGTTDRKGRLDINNRSHFFGKIVEAMRHALTDVAKRGGKAARAAVFVPLEDDTRISDDAAGLAEMLDIDNRLEELATINERQAQAIELVIYTGLTLDEAADVIGLSTAQLKRDLRAAYDWLRDELAPPDAV